nr:ribonuclease H-like domain-containing protein [Tanacetum cinerariifolium]
KDELKLKLENFQTSSKNLSKLLASQIIDKTGLGYDNQVFNSTVFDYDELISSESDVSMPTSPVHDRPSASIIKDWASDSKDKYEGELMPTQKAPSFVQTSKHVKTPRSSVKPVEHPILAEKLRTDIPKSRAILTRSRLVPLTAARPVTTVVPQTIVQHQRPTKHGVNKACSPIKRTINHRPSSKIVIFIKKLLMLRLTRLMLFREPRETGGYVAFGGNPKGGKITSKECDKKNNVLFTNTECIILSFDFKLPDENHVLLRVPRENNMYNVDIKNIVPSRDLTCLFTKATLDESNLWH